MKLPVWRIGGRRAVTYLVARWPRRSSMVSRRTRCPILMKLTVWRLAGRGAVTCLVAEWSKRYDLKKDLVSNLDQSLSLEDN